MKYDSQSATVIARMSLAAQGAFAATDSILDPATDPRIDPQIRSFLAVLAMDSSPFWASPQPRPQEILTAVQNQTGPIR